MQYIRWKRNKYNWVKVGIFWSIFFVPLISVSALAQGSDSQLTGILKGIVVDVEVKSPLQDAVVKIKEENYSVSTDENGEFIIAHLPVGIYTAEVYCPLYISRSVADIIVKSDRITFITIELKLDIEVEESQEITVTAGFFKDTQNEPASLNMYSNEEIRRAAGSGGDISRVVSGLPSISRVNDQKNSLIVRGGSPVENGFVVNNIEIPNINHYPSFGLSCGALGLLNVDFIQDVRFYSGGFPVQYGDRLSSVMDIILREGNREELDFQLDMSMVGVGAIGEGPVGKGAWLFSARKSYIDLLSGVFDVGVPPNWSDFQGKIDLDLSSRHKLTFLGVLGNDKSGWDREHSLELNDPSYGCHNAVEATGGVNWMFMWDSNGYSQTSLSYIYTDHDMSFFETLTENRLIKNNSSEQILSLRNINHYRVNNVHKLTFGLDAKYFSTGFDYSLGETMDVWGNRIPEFNEQSRFSAFYGALYFNHIWTPSQKISLDLGLRTDYFTLNKNLDVSPRLGMTYNFSERISLSGSAGLFHQRLPLALLFQSRSHQKLKNPAAYHYVIGIKYLLTENTRLTLDFYSKEYRNMPLDPLQPGLFVMDETFRTGYFSLHKDLVDSGQARSYGVEFMIQKKLALNLYGLVSGSYFKTRYKGFDGRWRNRVYDNQYIFSVEGGYRFNRNWEFGLKWHLAGGAPFTPFDNELSAAVNYGIYDITKINGARNPAYHTLNLRIDRRFFYNSSTLTIYFSVWNVYNQKNLAFYFWNSLENRLDRENQWGVLPVLGIEYEF